MTKKMSQEEFDGLFERAVARLRRGEKKRSTEHASEQLMPILLTKRQVAALLAVDEDTVDRYCNKRLIKFYRIKAGKRFDPADVQRFLDSVKFEAHSSGPPMRGPRDKGRP